MLTITKLCQFTRNVTSKELGELDAASVWYYYLEAEYLEILNIL